MVCVARPREFRSRSSIFLLRTTPSRPKLVHSATDEAEPSVVEEAPKKETTIEEEEKEEKPPRKPIIKFGDIMILNKRDVEAAEKKRLVPDIRTDDVVEIKLVFLVFYLCFQILMLMLKTETLKNICICRLLVSRFAMINRCWLKRKSSRRRLIWFACRCKMHEKRWSEAIARASSSGAENQMNANTKEMSFSQRD